MHSDFRNFRSVCSTDIGNYIRNSVMIISQRLRKVFVHGRIYILIHYDTFANTVDLYV